VDPSLHGRALLQALQSCREPASPDHDIDDPYRRGPEAARRAAVTMEALLEVVVERLRS
jgi:sulfate adenylyltransferase